VVGDQAPSRSRCGRSSHGLGRRGGPRSPGVAVPHIAVPYFIHDFETWDRICKLYGWPQTSQSGSSVTSRLPRLTTSSRLYPEAR
jgi:hypothetical protein